MLGQLRACVYTDEYLAMPPASGPAASGAGAGAGAAEEGGLEGAADSTPVRT